MIPPRAVTPRELLVVTRLICATPGGAVYAVDLARPGSDASERVGTVAAPTAGGWTWTADDAPAKGCPATLVMLLEDALGERFPGGR